jgi:hypothetical protein
MKLQPVGGFHLYILRLLNHRPSQSTPVRYPSPDHNRPTTKPIPLKNASVGEVFPATSVNHNINPLDWPPYSPDLSPIEHLWDKMDRRVRGRRNALATLDQLRAAMKRRGNILGDLILFIHY